MIRFVSIALNDFVLLNIRGSAENLINDVLRHQNQVVKVDLKTEVTDVESIKMLRRDGTRPDVDILWCNKSNTPGEYFYWMAPELAYHITVTLQVCGLKFVRSQESTEPKSPKIEQSDYFRQVNVSTIPPLRAF